MQNILKNACTMGAEMIYSKRCKKHGSPFRALELTRVRGTR